jgi:hypothetical protein
MEENNIQEFNIVDFVGNNLCVGDWVALSMESQTALTYGKIEKISYGKTQKKISLHIKLNIYDNTIKRINKNSVRIRRPHNVIKISKEVLIEKVLCDN